MSESQSLPPSEPPSDNDSYYILNPEDVDPVRLRKERDKAREMKKSQWWLNLLQKGICHYCEKKFAAKDLTMDHIVPLARGGRSTKGNLAPACKDCNRKKKLDTPVEELFKKIQSERE